MLLILRDRTLLVVVKLLVACGLYDLPIAGWVNVLACSIENHFSRELTDPRVLTAVSVDENVVAVRLEEGPDVRNVAIQNLHARLCQTQRIKIVVGRSFELLLVDEPTIVLAASTISTVKY